MSSTTSQPTGGTAGRETDESGLVSRREVGRRVLTVGATVSAPAFVEVASGATDSGHVEIEATATVPTDTSLSVTIYEDSNGDGSADRQQTESIPDGTNTVAYDALEGVEAQGYHYWMELNLSTSDDSVTPEMDTMTITLPETMTTPEPTEDEQPAEPQGIDALWDNFLVFVAIAVGGMGALAGVASKSGAIGAFIAYMVFAHIAVETGDPLLINILYVTLVLIIVGMAFKLWRLEFGGDA